MCLYIYNKLLKPFIFHLPPSSILVEVAKLFSFTNLHPLTLKKKSIITIFEITGCKLTVYLGESSFHKHGPAGSNLSGRFVTPNRIQWFWALVRTCPITLVQPGSILWSCESNNIQTPIALPFLKQGNYSLIRIRYAPLFAFMVVKISSVRECRLKSNSMREI